MATNQVFYYFYSKQSYDKQREIYLKMGKVYKPKKVSFNGRIVSYTNKSTSSSILYNDARLVAQGANLIEFN